MIAVFCDFFFFFFFFWYKQKRNHIYHYYQKLSTTKQVCLLCGSVAISHNPSQFVMRQFKVLSTPRGNPVCTSTKHLCEHQILHFFLLIMNYTNVQTMQIETMGPSACVTRYVWICCVGQCKSHTILVNLSRHCSKFKFNALAAITYTSINPAQVFIITVHIFFFFWSKCDPLVIQKNKFGWQSIWAYTKGLMPRQL